jgi:hypothetical protein
VPVRNVTTTIKKSQEEKKEENFMNPVANDRMNLLFLCDAKPRPLNLDFRTLSSLPELRTFPYPSPRTLKRSQPDLSIITAAALTDPSAATSLESDLSKITPPQKKRLCIKKKIRKNSKNSKKSKKSTIRITATGNSNTCFICRR